eukprot:1147773-Pelagomonas_calceolata.AAC.1
MRTEAHGCSFAYACTLTRAHAELCMFAMVVQRHSKCVPMFPDIGTHTNAAHQHLHMSHEHPCACTLPACIYTCTLASTEDMRAWKVSSQHIRGESKLENSGSSSKHMLALWLHV